MHFYFCSLNARSYARVKRVLLFRLLTSGAASTRGLEEYALRYNATQLARRFMPRTGWSIPTFAFGADDIGASAAERAGLLVTAVLRKGINAVLIDGDELLARRDAGNGTWSPRQLKRDWEATAFARIFASGHVDRSEMLIMAKLTASPTREVDVEDSLLLHSRVSKLVSALDLRTLDILHVHVPINISAGALHNVFKECEALVDSRSIQFYGISASAFTATDVVHSEGNAAEDETHGMEVAEGVRKASLNNAGRVGLPLRMLFECAERMRVTGRESNGAMNPPAPDALRSAHNGSRHRSETLKDDHGGASRAYDSGKRHHFVSLMYAHYSLSHPDAAVPTITDGQHGAPMAAADVAARYGLTQFACRPFDAWFDVPAVDTLLGLNGRGSSLITAGAESSTAPRQHGSDSDSDSNAVGKTSPRIPRLFRCTDVESRVSSTTTVRDDMPPDFASSSAISALSEALNSAVHLEVVWEQRGVRDELMQALRTAAVEAEGSHSLKTSPAQEAAPKSADAAAAAAAAGTALLVSNAAPHLPPQAPQEGDVTWARMLAANLDRLDSWAEWRELHGHRLLPALQRIADAARVAPTTQEWASAYVAAMRDVYARIDELQAAGQQRRTAALSAALDNAVPELATTPHLHVKSARLLLAAAPAIDVLVTEAPLAFGVRKRKAAEIVASRVRARELRAAAAVTARADSVGGESTPQRSRIPGSIRDDADPSMATAAAAASPRNAANDDVASFDRESAAMDARLAARTAEVDDFIASLVAPSDSDKMASVAHHMRTKTKSHQRPSSSEQETVIARVSSSHRSETGPIRAISESQRGPSDIQYHDATTDAGTGGTIPKSSDSAAMAGTTPAFPSDWVTHAHFSIPRDSALSALLSADLRRSAEVAAAKPLT